MGEAVQSRNVLKQPSAVGVRLLFVVNDAAFFVSHRLPIAVAAIKADYEVHVATAPGEGVSQIREAGCIHHELPISRTGRNIIAEFRTLLSIWLLFRSLQPKLVHLVTVKPVLYGGIAARFAKVGGVVSAISGLGHIFDEAKAHRVIGYAVGLLYRFAFSHRNLAVIFQNTNDRSELLSFTGLDEKRTRMFRGSGVDLDLYAAEPERAGIPVVTFASRLLRNKGVNDFVTAAGLLKDRGVAVKFWLVGGLDTHNPEAISASELEDIQKSNVVEVLGSRSDIPALFASSHIVTLPSYYREGLPKVLMEAAACGRAIVTTDHPGCRDAIEPGLTGLLVPPREPIALADAIQELLENNSLRKMMGSQGRKLAEKEFSIGKIVSDHLAIYQDLLNKAEVSAASGPTK